MTPKMEEAELLEKQRQDSLLSRMKMFIHLRQDLERVRCHIDLLIYYLYNHEMGLYTRH